MEASSSLLSDLGSAVNEAVSLGAQVVTNSYGSSEFSGESTFDSYYNHPGVAITASSGDNGYGVSYPAASPYVIAVGGTTLLTAHGTKRGFTEIAWSGSGSGCSAYEPKPTWQTDTGCSNRTVADVSADGDPSTPVQTYDSYGNGGWITLGGTSASSPIVAGIDALAENPSVFAAGANAFYSSAYGFPGSVFDITAGSTGSCGGSYLCTALAGYDGPTGLGSPNGPPPPTAASGNPGVSTFYGTGNSGVAAARPCQTGDPVNCATGNLSETVTDLAVPGRGRPLAFTRTYNAIEAATAAAPDALGYGWTDSYAASLSIDAGTGNVTVHQGNGSTLAFTNASGAYTAPPWVNATLTKNADASYTLTYLHGNADRFSSTGQLSSETDRHGYTTTLAYGGNQLTSVTDPAGRSLTLSYNGSGQLVMVTDPAGRSVSYSYDASGNLASVTDPTGAVTAYSYDGSHRLTALTRPGGGVTTNSYDASNRVSSQTNPLGHTTTFAYAGSGSSTTTTITDPNGNVTVEQYTDEELTSLTRGYGTPQAATWNYSYDQHLERQTTVDPSGRGTHAIYDHSGNLLTATDALGRVSTYTYDSGNDLTSRTDPAGNTTTISYDVGGDPTSVTRTLAGTGQSAVTRFSYADSSHPGDLTGITDPDGNQTTLAYDANGDLTSSTDPDANKTTIAYNAIGWRTSSTSARGNAPGANPSAFTTAYAYDQAGDLTSVTDPLGHVTSYAYDGDHNRIKATDADGKVTSYAYDLADHLTKVTRADASTLRYGYDADGNRITQIDGLGHTTSYAYDPLDRVSSVTDPLGRATSYAYDGAGNRTSLKNPSGQTTTYAYDAANELVGISYSDATTPNVTYSYDPDGHRVQMTDSSGTTSYAYDSLGRLTSVINGAGYMVGYGYDLAGRTTSITYPNGRSLARGYDAAGRLTSVSDWLGNTSRFGYDPNGNLTGESYPNGASAALSYNDADQLTAITHATNGTPFLSFSYTRDADGQLSAQTTSTGTTSYGYDPLNRLTAVNATATGASYGYDAADDLTGFIDGTTQSFDAANELTQSSQSAVATHTYAYNPQGDRTSAATAGQATIGYAYDQSDRLTSNGAGYSYGYDGDGLRVAKLVPSSSGAGGAYIWDVSSPTPLLLGDLANNYLYGPNDLPIEQISAGNVAVFFHQDQLGSTRALTGPGGAVVATYGYDPYGRTTSATGSVTTPLGFAGQYTDPETGFIYLRARYYDPATGQFLTRDPLEAVTGEAYGYAGDSPLNRSDPSGLGCHWYDIVCDATAVVNAGANAVGALGDAAIGAGKWIYNHSGHAAEGAAAGVCIFASDGACAYALGFAFTASSVQNGVNASSAANFFEQEGLTVAENVLIGGGGLIKLGLGLSGAFGSVLPESFFGRAAINAVVTWPSAVGIALEQQIADILPC